MSGNCNCVNPKPGGCHACNGYSGNWTIRVPAPVSSPMRQGWLCPACGHGNAPWIPYCVNCKRTSPPDVVPPGERGEE